MDARYGIDQELISAQDAWNAAQFHEILNRPVRERSLELARAREAYSRKVLRRRLPRLLHWTLDHPSVLRALLQIIPRWRPMMIVVQLGITTTAMTAVESSERWLKEQEALGRDVSDPHVFTYTDVNELPAEIYGP